jgi:hypothetical protein
MRRDDADETRPVEGYEPPRIERVLTADDLAREVQYAGLITVGQQA